MNANKVKNIIKESYNKSICTAGYYLACYMKRHDLKWSMAPLEMYGWGVNDHIVFAMCHYSGKKIGLSDYYLLNDVVEKFLNKKDWEGEVIKSAKNFTKKGIVPFLKKGESAKMPDGFDLTIWNAIMW